MATGLSPKVRELRSQPARDRILCAARVAFAADGYERTTVRGIAAIAKVNPAMVIRYYGSKEGIFTAAVAFELRLPDLSDVPRSELGSGLVAHFVARWEGPETFGELQSLLRAAVSHSGARDKLLSVFESQLAAAVATITAPSEADRRAGLVASQMLGLALARYVLQLPEIVAMHPAALAAAIGPTIDHYIFGELTTSS